MSWRKVSEVVKQKWGLSHGRDFVPTSNARNEAMFAEAERFEKQLKNFEKDLKAWQKDVDETFKNMRAIMLSPLPRVYDINPEGTAMPQGNPVLIGLDIEPDQFSIAAADLKNRLDQEVLKPIKDWTTAYNIIKDYMKKLEELRLTLDSRRRTVRTLEGKYQRQHTSGNFQQHELDETEFKIKHKADKMDKDRQQFIEREQQLYGALSSLITDTSVLRDYAAAAILIMKDCFERAYAAFDGNARQRLPPVRIPDLTTAQSMPVIAQEKKSKSIMGFGFGIGSSKQVIHTHPMQPDTPQAGDQHYQQFAPYPPMQSPTHRVGSPYHNQQHPYGSQQYSNGQY